MHDPVIRESWALMIGLPLTPFTLLTPSLGLLLGEFYLASEKKVCRIVPRFGHWLTMSFLSHRTTHGMGVVEWNL
jgi:hypothetical protein